MAGALARAAGAGPVEPGRLVGLVAEAVRAVADTEVMPRFLRVARQRKADGSLCTEADLGAQAALGAALGRLHAVPVLGEEMPREQQRALWECGAGGLWCVDPVDGTSNFVHGLPHFSVAVALLVAGRPVLGVVHDPVAGETFHAVAGGGAFLNGVALPLQAQSLELRQAMAAVDFKRLPRALAVALAATPPYASQRNYGAGTLDWCYLAAGRLDVCVHGGQKPWDYAAGALILAEAGGCVATLEGSDFWAAEPWTRSVVAARDPLLFAAWQAWLEVGPGPAAGAGEAARGRPLP